MGKIASVGDIISKCGVTVSTLGSGYCPTYSIISANTSLNVSGTTTYASNQLVQLDDIYKVETTRTIYITVRYLVFHTNSINMSLPMRVQIGNLEPIVFTITGGTFGCDGYDETTHRINAPTLYNCVVGSAMYGSGNVGDKMSIYINSGITNGIYECVASGPPGAVAFPSTCLSSQYNLQTLEVGIVVSDIDDGYIINWNGGYLSLYAYVQPYNNNNSSTYVKYSSTKKTWATMGEFNNAESVGRWCSSQISREIPGTCSICVMNFRNQVWKTGFYYVLIGGQFFYYQVTSGEADGLRNGEIYARNMIRN